MIISEERASSLVPLKLLFGNSKWQSSWFTTICLPGEATPYPMQRPHLFLEVAHARDATQRRRFRKHKENRYSWRLGWRDWHRCYVYPEVLVINDELRIYQSSRQIFASVVRYANTWSWVLVGFFSWIALHHNPLNSYTKPTTLKECLSNRQRIVILILCFYIFELQELKGWILVWINVERIISSMSMS